MPDRIGSAEQAIEFVLTLPSMECADFIHRWRDGTLVADEWGDYLSTIVSPVVEKSGTAAADTSVQTGAGDDPLKK